MAGRKRKPRSVFPLHGKAQADAPPAVETSVEAHWPPLTPEHGFPSLRFRPGHRALPLCPLPVPRGAGLLSRNTSFPVKVRRRMGRKKTAGHSARGDRSDNTSCIGITRSRFGGSKRDASSQPCGSPVGFGPILHPLPGACQGRSEFFVKKSANPLAMTVRRE